MTEDATYGTAEI